MEELKAGMTGVRVIKKCLLSESNYIWLVEIIGVRERETYDGKKVLDIIYTYGDVYSDPSVDIYSRACDISVYPGEIIDDVIKDEDGTLKIVLSYGEDCVLDEDGYSKVCGRRTCIKQQ